MPEYINKQQILEKAKKHQHSPFAASLIIAEIEKADGVDVKRGKWIYNTDDFTPAMRCSSCRYNKPLIAGERIKQEPNNYCPNCGARMDGDVNG